jgi:uncharacterized protein YgiB involved in biofilm formation
MADDVQRLLLQIDASATLLRQEVAKARNDIDGFADRGAAKLKKIDAGFAGIGIAANAATARIAGFAAGLLTVGQAASFMVRANADMQRLSAMLEVATGSAGSAATAMSQLQAFAAETPFTLGQVTEAYIKLKNLGLDPSVDAMRSFGNTSAAMGKDLMQFIEAVADASTGQFERLLDFGIKASKSGEQVKFTFQGVTTTVQNNAAAITSFLRSLGDEGGVFAASMTKQMDTIDGKLSNLEDAAGRLATTVGSMGFNSAFIQTLDYLSNTMSGMAAMLQSRGWKGLFASHDDIMQAATPKGNAEVLRARRDAAARELDAARNARVLGKPQPQMVANAKAAFDARNREYVTFMRANADVADPMSRFALNERGPFGAAPTAPTSSTKTAEPKTTKAGPQEFTLASMESGWALRQLSDAGTPANIEMSNQALRSVADTMDELASYDFQINPIGQEQIALAEDYARTLTEGLAQAVVYGRNFGDVLKGLAQQIAASGLINILSGGKLGTSFGDALGGLGKIFGGFREAGGPVQKGKSYIVGEKRPELFVPKQDGFVMPRVPAEFGKSDDEEPRLAGLREQLQSLRLPAAPETNRAATAMQRDETPEQQATARLMKELKAKFGGFRETGGSVMPGKAYVVGEKRPEVFVPSTAGYIMPRVPTGQGEGGQQSVSVTVNPSPLFITTVTQGAQMAAQETLRKTTRQRMPQSAGV